MSRVRSWLTIVAVAITVLAARQGTAETAPDPSRQVDALFSSTFHDGTPGIAVLVAQDGRVLHQKGYGLADLERHVPIEPSTRFYLASVTKPFTAMAILMLVEQRKLTTESRLSELLPQFKSDAAAIQIRHLLQHTSGLADYIESSNPGDAAPANVMEKIVDWVAAQSLEFPSGTRFEYSNSGYVVLARVIEKVSGLSYPGFIQKNILEPVGMDRSLVLSPGSPVPQDLAIGYAAAGDEFERTGFGTDALDRIYGDGGIVSTVEDLYRWDQALYTESLLKTSTMRQAFTPGTLPDGTDIQYGFGWQVETFRGIQILSHNGAWSGFSAIVARCPERRFTVILLSNLDDLDVSDYTEKIAKIYRIGESQ